MPKKILLVSFVLLAACAESPDRHKFAAKAIESDPSNANVEGNKGNEGNEGISPVNPLPNPNPSPVAQMPEAPMPAPMPPVAQLPAPAPVPAPVPVPAPMPAPVPVPAPFAPCPEKGQVCAIMPLGDSITWGANAKNGGGYREPLFKTALKAGKKITFVGNGATGPEKVDNLPFPRNQEGHPGWTIQKTDKRPGIYDIIEESLAKNKPHIITLMIGTNDVDTNYELDKAGQRLEQLIDRIISKSPNALIVLAKIVPAQNDGLNERIKTFNARMDKIVMDRVMKGKHLMLVDMFKAVSADPDYKKKFLADNLHPNEAGFEVMAEVWWKAIQDKLP